MKNDNISEFVDNDIHYLRWLKNHSEGYVINTTRSKSSSYMVLHRSICPLISEFSKRRKVGGFTERDYIKICSDDLSNFVPGYSQMGDMMVNLVASVLVSNRMKIPTGNFENPYFDKCFNI